MSNQDSASTNRGTFVSLIGINKYKKLGWSLRGAVPDVEAYNKYFTDRLKVPVEQISTLVDEQASREAIINAFVSLAEDDRIKKGDAIFIMFAGHGSEVKAPAGWDEEGTVQVIVPQDYSEKAGQVVPAIYDRTIGALLERIAKRKGNNITVVLDCCHSASGTRGTSGASAGSRSRSVPVLGSIHTEDLDHRIWNQRVNTTSNFRYRGSRSHMCFAACRSSELAREAFGRGDFSTALLKFLWSISPHQIRYSEVLSKIDRLPDGQNPQLEGAHRNRFLFDSKVRLPPPPCYPLRFNKRQNLLCVDVGSAVGITKGAEFATLDIEYRKAEILGSLETLRVIESTPFSSVLEPVEVTTRSLKKRPRKQLAQSYQNLVVVQTKPGERDALRLYISLENRPACLELLQRCNSSSRPIFTVVDMPDLAQLVVSIVGRGVIFSLADKRLLQDGRNFQYPDIDCDSVEEVATFIQRTSEFFFNLDRKSDHSLLMEGIDVSFRKLEESGIKLHPSAKAEMKAVGADLNQNNAINLIVEEDCVYGIKLTNNSPSDLYAVLTYFDSATLSTQTYYESLCSGPYLLDPPLKKLGGTLTVGYGSGGIPPLSYRLPNGCDRAIGFLKLSISTRPLNSTGSTPHISPYADTVCQWSTTLLPIIQQRHPKPKALTLCTEPLSRSLSLESEPNSVVSPVESLNSWYLCMQNLPALASQLQIQTASLQVPLKHRLMI